MLNLPLMDFLPRQRELTATRRAHNFGHFLTGEELHEAVGKLDSRRMVFVFGSLAQVAGWFEFDGAADHPGAAEVDVAFLADIAELEVIYGDDGVWKRLEMEFYDCREIRSGGGGLKVVKGTVSCNIHTI